MAEVDPRAKFLYDCVKEKKPVTLFLMNGVKLQGVISSFGVDSYLLAREDHIQLVERHAVSTVMPASAPVRKGAE